MFTVEFKLFLLGVLIVLIGVFAGHKINKFQDQLNSTNAFQTQVMQTLRRVQITPTPSIIPTATPTASLRLYVPIKHTITPTK